MSTYDQRPSITLCRVYEAVSANGNRYLRGRLGEARIVVRKTSELTADGTPIWIIQLQEAPPSQKGDKTDMPQRDLSVGQFLKAAAKRQPARQDTTADPRASNVVPLDARA